jgi:hypothetical protein
MPHCDSHNELVDILKEIKTDIKEVKEEIKSLSMFRASLLGAGAVISALISFTMGLFNR